MSGFYKTVVLILKILYILAFDIPVLGSQSTHTFTIFFSIVLISLRNSVEAESAAKLNKNLENVLIVTYLEKLRDLP